MFGKHKVSPLLRFVCVLANDICKNLHPSVLIRGTIGVEVNRFTIGEADAESLFHKHVAFFFLGERRLSTTATLAGGLLLRQGSLVINEFTRFREIDCRSRLTSGFVVSSKFRATEGEEPATPVLHLVSAQI